MASLLLAFTACRDEGEHEIIPDIPTAEKTPIALSVGGLGDEGATRAITKEPTDNSKLDVLPAGTAIYMVMKSEKKNGSSSDTKYALTKGITGEAVASTKKSPIDFSADGCTRYWDDCYARDAMLSVYAACCPGSKKTIKIDKKDSYAHTTMPTTGAWSATAIGLTIADWQVSSEQTAQTITDEDLCYSNNIANNSSPNTDGRLQFNLTSGKFDHGNLCFYHALSWITFEIVMGDGFTANEFNFADGSNITLKGFNTSNTKFDIATGEFKADGYSSSVISKMYQRDAATDGSTFTLDARVLPMTDMSSDNKGDIELTIAGNNYKLSKKDLLDKISSNDKTNHMVEPSKLKPGVHYTFTLRISKTSVNISAKIVDWEEVSADELIPSNAKVTLQLEDRTGTTTNADIYRSAEKTDHIEGDITSISGKGYVWDKGYAGPNKLTDDKLVTAWFWPNNKTFYHFRAIAPQGQTKKETDNKDYIALTHGENKSYIDITWGAPFKDINAEIQYTTTLGFDGTESHQIYHAIGATKSPINLLMFHAMSDITFKVYTTEDADKVELADDTGGNYTTIKLENISTTGKIYLGNGLVEADGPKSSHSFTTHPATDADGKLTWSNYGAIPQALDDVVLVITTLDHNEYRVAMKDVVASSAISNTNVQYPAYTDNKVNYWYPGVKYTYTFKLKKKGIDIKVTILDWETVTAGDDNVQIQ